MPKSTSRQSWLFVPMIALSAALGGCGTVHFYDTKSLSAKALNSAKTGIVIVSTGASEGCIDAATYLWLMPADKPYGQSKAAAVPVDNGFLRSDFPDHYGVVHAIVLPPGSYYFAPWKASAFEYTVRAPRFDFSVGAGEIVYLGAYEMPGHCITGSGKIYDQWSRDRAFVAQRNPNIDLSRVTVRLMTHGGDAINTLR